MDKIWFIPQWEEPAIPQEYTTTQPLKIEIPSWDYNLLRVSQDSLLLRTVPGSSAPALEEKVSLTAAVEQDDGYLHTPTPHIPDSLEQPQLPPTKIPAQVQETATALEDNDDEVTEEYLELMRILGDHPSENFKEDNSADVERFCEEFPSLIDSQPQDSTENRRPQDPSQQDISTPVQALTPEPAPDVVPPQEAVPFQLRVKRVLPTTEPALKVPLEEPPLPQRQLRGTQTRRSVFKTLSKAPAGSLENPFQGKTARQILAESAVEPTGSVKCSHDYTCRVESHRLLGLFTELHNSIPANVKLITLYILTCAITLIDNGVRVCVLCNSEPSKRERGTFFQLLEHALKHGLMLAHCENVDDVVRCLHNLIQCNKLFRWNCSFPNCSYSVKNPHMLYIHFVAVHRNLSTQLMLFCPFCLMPLQCDFIEHISQPHPLHIFSCCTKDEQMSFVDYFSHFVRAHPRKLLSQLDQNTRVCLVNLWE
jgi:hypothetical protein